MDSIISLKKKRLAQVFFALMKESDQKSIMIRISAGLHTSYNYYSDCQFCHEEKEESIEPRRAQN